MRIEEVSIEKITSNPMNPREKIDREKIDELANSIKTVGLKVPIIVRPKGKQFEIISGERRWTAAKKAKVKKVTVLVKDLDDDEMAIESLIANEFRENLDPWERAKYLKRIKNMAGVESDEELGKFVGMSKQAIQMAWRYLDIDDDVKEKVNRGLLEPRVAREIGSIKDKKVQRKVAKIAAKRDMTLRETESFVSTVKRAPDSIKKAVLEEKIDVEDVKSLVEYGIPKGMEKPTVEELTVRKQERDELRKLEAETDISMVKGEITAKEIKVQKERDEKIYRDFESTSFMVSSWRPFHFERIKSEKWRKKAIECVREIRDSADALLESLKEEE